MWYQFLSIFSLIFPAQCMKQCWVPSQPDLCYEDYNITVASVDNYAILASWCGGQKFSCGILCNATGGASINTCEFVSDFSCQCQDGQYPNLTMYNVGVFGTK